ncbi:MAG: methionyl-tRNA formyltransferase [Clostridia bacterium]|nr:methionyl-tRNA formyltransferase [Clostridia bacterium]MDD4386759.1 methionyl-tRNA formyltransferase [Clostridia bacterium]
MNRKDIKIVFMGTPEFAKCSLEGLYDSGYNIIGVFTNPDTLSGRGMKLKSSPVKEYANEKNIPVFQPEKIRKNEEVIKILNELNPDIIVVTAYGKILPKEILDLPRFGCINVHGSLLPKYRGAAPIHHSIMNGESETGITTMFMDVGMDTGDMLLKETVIINDEDNLETMTNKLMKVGSELLVKTLDKLIIGDIVRIKQEGDFSIAPMIKKEMTKIDWSKTPREIFNFVRGLSPYIGSYIVHSDGRKFKVLEVKEAENIEGNNGSVVLVTKNRLVIKCKNGSIEIKKIQPLSSKIMEISPFLNGNKIELGEMFK